MQDDVLDDRIYRDVMKARLVLGFVSARAEKCPNRVCGRARHCTARFAPGAWLHATMGACPNMSEAEWGIVSLGIRQNKRLVEPWFDARDAAAREAEAPSNIWKLSAEERWRRWHLPEAVAARAEAERRRLAQPGPFYWQLLWLQIHDDAAKLPRDVRKEDARFLRFKMERGCRCAIERRSDACGEAGEDASHAP